MKESDDKIARDILWNMMIIMHGWEEKRYAAKPEMNKITGGIIF